MMYNTHTHTHTCRCPRTKSAPNQGRNSQSVNKRITTGNFHLETLRNSRTLVVRMYKYSHIYIYTCIYICTYTCITHTNDIYICTALDKHGERVELRVTNEQAHESWMQWYMFETRMKRQTTITNQKNSRCYQSLSLSIFAVQCCALDQCRHDQMHCNPCLQKSTLFPLWSHVALWIA